MLTGHGRAFVSSLLFCGLYHILSLVKMVLCGEKEIHKLLGFVDIFFRGRAQICLWIFRGVKHLKIPDKSPTDGCVPSSEVESALHSPQQEKLCPSVFAVICFVHRQTHASRDSCFYHFTTRKCLSQSWGHLPTAMEFKDTVWPQRSCESIVLQEIATQGHLGEVVSSDLGEERDGGRLGVNVCARVHMWKLADNLKCHS